jgi:nucleotide-binding universal stress UspA family protein
MSESTGGPVVIAYDGSAAANEAIRRSAALIGPRRALVVHVWEPGLPFELVTPTIPPAPVDIRAALELEEELMVRSQQLAEQGAAAAREAGFDAEGLTVADDSTVPETLVQVSRERQAVGLVVGSHGHRGITEALVGGTTKHLLRHAPCPVVVVRSEHL